MATILWNTNVNAPCCPGEIVRVLPKGERVERGDDGRFRRVEPDTILIQTDWDFPGIAQSFGWSLREVQKEALECDHDGIEIAVRQRSKRHHPLRARSEVMCPT